MELLLTMEKHGTLPKNYGTMDITMVLIKKLWYYIDNYGTSIHVGKNMVDYQL